MGINKLIWKDRSRVTGRYYILRWSRGKCNMYSTHISESRSSSTSTKQFRVVTILSLIWWTIRRGGSCSERKLFVFLSFTRWWWIWSCASTVSSIHEATSNVCVYTNRVTIKRQARRSDTVLLRPTVRRDRMWAAAAAVKNLTQHISPSLYLLFVPTFVFGLVLQNSTLSETNANVTKAARRRNAFMAGTNSILSSVAIPTKKSVWIGWFFYQEWIAVTIIQRQSWPKWRSWRPTTSANVTTTNINNNRTCWWCRPFLMISPVNFLPRRLHWWPSTAEWPTTMMTISILKMSQPFRVRRRRERNISTW